MIYCNLKVDDKLSCAGILADKLDEKQAQCVRQEIVLNTPFGDMILVGLLGEEFVSWAKKFPITNKQILLDFWESLDDNTPLREMKCLFNKRYHNLFKSECSKLV